MNKKYILSLLVVLTTVALFLTSFTTINTKEIVGVKNNFLNTNIAQTHIPPINRKIVNIPDANLKNTLLRQFKNSNSYTSAFYKKYIKPENEFEIYEDELEILKKIPGNFRTPSDLFINDANFEKFYVDYKIKDLTGLEKAINLTEIVLPVGEVEDLTPISNLTKLEWLNLNKHKISNIDKLGNLKNIKYLVLENNSIKDISILKNFKNLEVVELANNKIENIDIFNLEFEKLESVDLENNLVKDASSLKNGKGVFLKGNQIKDLRKLKVTTRYFTTEHRSNKFKEEEFLNNQTIIINPEENKFELGLFLNDGTKLDVEAEGLIDNNDGTYSLKDPNIGINFKYKDIFDVTINPIEEKEVVKVEEENKEVEVTTNTNDNTTNTSDINKITTNKDGSLSSNKLPYAGTTTNILLVISIMLVIIYSNKVLRKQKLINSLSKIVDKGIRK